MKGGRGENESDLVGGERREEGMEGGGKGLGLGDEFGEVDVEAGGGVDKEDGGGWGECRGGEEEREGVVDYG